MPIYWDDERDRPDPVAAADLEDYDVREAAEAFVAAYRAWERIEANDSEAEARRAYAEHVAHHLVGVFPNCRVAPAAYAAALGEELADRSADIVKAVAQRARRTLKALPPIAVLVEWADTEARRRHQQAMTYMAAQDAHAAALARGQQQAESIAKQVATHATDLDAEAVLAIWRVIAGRPLGLTSLNPTDARNAEDLRAVFRAIGEGDREAAAAAREILRELRAHLAAEAAADQANDDGSWCAAYEARRAARVRWAATLAGMARGAAAGPPDASCAHPVGSMVRHAKFGDGRVIGVDEDRLEVEFGTGDVRRLLARFVESPDP